MLLAVTMRSALQQRFGADDYDKLRAALAAFGNAAGAQTLALDDPEETKALGVGPALGPDAGSITAALRQFTRIGGGANAVLLVGGDDIIPYWQITNPVTDRTLDPDDQIPSDNPYGSTDDTWDQYLAPSIPVGRLADSSGGSTQDFVDLLQTATANRQGRIPRSGSAVVVNSEWVDYSQSAAAALPDPVNWHLAPGYLLNAATGSDADHACLYFNLHGFSGQPAWKAYDEVRSAFITAVTPDAFNSENVSGSVVFAENCYGAETIGRSPDNSCALRLLQQGAAFVGATGTAFGSHIAPNLLLDDADLLAQYFWSAYRGGQPVGTALRFARTQYLGSESATDVDAFKKKTLLQFILLGDPGWTLN